MDEDFDIPPIDEMNEDMDLPDGNLTFKVGEEKESRKQGLKKKLVKEGICKRKFSYLTATFLEEKKIDGLDDAHNGCESTGFRVKLPRDPNPSMAKSSPIDPLQMPSEISREPPTTVGPGLVPTIMDAGDDSRLGRWATSHARTMNPVDPSITGDNLTKNTAQLPHFDLVC
ncbi:hypothetical protein NE237_012436 [Protea cynaroides]|uniref:Uncharacterized protein n=1 Tax=Protea cynaroides TaxID=273540 RepID=A0A9Q0JZ84_9MAGN|nr:hypothetical protein NE237_012436 [Protea cynaroides]